MYTWTYVLLPVAQLVHNSPVGFRTITARTQMFQRRVVICYFMPACSMLWNMHRDHHKLHSMSTTHLCGLLQGLRGEGEVAALAQVVVVHALGHLGDGVIAGQSLPTQSCSTTVHCSSQLCKQAQAIAPLACMMFTHRFLESVVALCHLRCQDGTINCAA